MYRFSKSYTKAYLCDASQGDASNGMALFRTNCAMCHNAVGAGGALSEGKFAPALWETSERNIYQAMLTGPQSMPVFNDANITPDEKRDIVSFLVEQREGSAGGNALGAQPGCMASRGQGAAFSAMSRQPGRLQRVVSRCASPM